MPEREFLDGMDTTPIHGEIEVVVIDGPFIAVPLSTGQGDDRDDGENWIEDMLERTSNEVPADDPLGPDGLLRKR